MSEAEAPEGRRAAPRALRFLDDDDDDPGEERRFGPAFSTEPWALQGVLLNVAPVRRDDAERGFDADVGELGLARGDRVVLETERGVELAVVLAPPRRAWLAARPEGRVLRRAAESDLAQEQRHRLREAAATRAAAEVVRGLGLNAKVVRAELSANAGRTVVFVAAEERLDLRELARTLSAALRGRVDVRHLGLRDAARVTGGIGPCGLQLCCNTFLAEFAPVSIRMAKDQGLALNPQRVSGVCGRLLCCLVYEDAFYRQQRARFPKPGKRVQTPRGEGAVRDVDVLASTVRVALREGALETFALDEVTALEPAAPPAPPPSARRER